MKNRSFLKTIVGLAIAFAMTFTPISSSYAVLDDSGGNGGEQVTESQAADAVPEDVVSEETEPTQPEVVLEETEPSQPDAITEHSEPAEQTKPEMKEEAKPADETAEKAERTEYVWKDGKVKVTAVLSDADAIPDDAELVAKAVTSKSDSYDYDAYMDALNKNADSRYDERNTILYDVAFIKDGVEIQPETGTVSVTFEFLDNQLSKSIGAKKASDVNVIHLPLKDKIKDKYDTTADAKNIDADDIVVEELTKKDHELAVSVKKEKVKFETSEFSVYAYTVDFEYTDPATGTIYTYNLEGAGSITLKELAIILGITAKADADEFIRNVEDVKFSNEDLVTVKKTLLRGWVLKSLKPFTSEELLTITMNDGTVIKVRVTDDVAESTDLTDFLVNAVVTGATQNSSGAYVVEAGQEYSIILSFAESSDYQFANHETLTYQMPAGIKVLEPQSGPLKINIVYKGRTYQVDGSFDLDTNGNLEIKFDETDPDFPRLTEATNVGFRFTYHAEFEGEVETIHFSDEVERDIVFDQPDPGQAYAKKSATYDESTGTFHYTITVTATGDVTDVFVKDTVLGNALIVDRQSINISGNSSTPTGGMNDRGFEYTFPSMNEGEVITIKYDARVDFSKDIDGDGKITADQTKNTVTVDPDPGDPHNSEYSREIRYKYTVKKDGTEAGTTPEGDKIIDWSIDYNPLALVAVGGDSITDRIAGDSSSYMKYYGNGITVVVKDHSGNTVRTENIAYSSLTEHSDAHWKYTIPSTDRTPYSYHITYQTVVDMAAVSGIGTAVTLNNTANDDGSSIDVSPENQITVDKKVESYTTKEVTWNSTLSIPQDGLTRAVVTDTLPARWFDGSMHYDILKDGTLEITGLLDGENYDVAYNTGSVVITFYYIENGVRKNGLKAYPGGRNVHVRLTTKVNQEWLEKGYEVADLQSHMNTIDLNSVQDTANVIFGKPGIEKTAETADKKTFKYTITIKGLQEEPFSIKDTFDTNLLEVDTSEGEDTDKDWYHMHIWGGSQHSQDFGRTPVSYTDTEDGITITANAVPKQADGNFYPYYKIIYYLKLKDGVDLEELAIANGGEYELINKAIWADHETEYKYKVKYDYLDKELLNEGQIGGTNRTAQYKITFNSKKATLNGGEPMEMKDVLSDNLSIDYGSINITTDPAGVSVPYSISGGPNGTTVATYTVPDSTKVVITYTAQVRGNGSQKIVNTVTVNGENETEEDTQDYGETDEGTGAIASFKIVKVDGYDATKKLKGVQFKIFAENPNLNFGENANYAKAITLTTDENGEIMFDGADYNFYFNEVYHVQEVAPAPDYANIGFDYLVTLTNDMAQVDYGHYIYYFSDSMQIKNWPLEGLIVEKQVDSDDDADKDRYYTFRVSILNADGTVNTNYNEKNGDDQFVNGVVEFQIKDKEQKMFWGFEKGTKYKVEEIDAEGFATTVTYKVFDEDGNVIETKTDPGASHSGEFTQEDEVIVFKNSKHDEKGSLKIKKNVRVNGHATTGTAADGTYTFTISGPNNYSSEQTITITNGISNEVQVDNLDPGTYTVTEDTSKNPAGMVLIGDNGVEVEVTANNTANIPTAEFTNNKTEVGSLKIKKNVTVNGKTTTGTAADGTYTFTISGPNDYSSEQTITITNGVSNEVQVDNLEPGTYTVTEDTSKNPEGMALVGENGVEVAVTANNTANVPTAEFTNNKTEVGSLKIKKNVTVNGKTTTGTSADGTYTFQVKDAEGNVKAEKTITITNGVSNEVQVDNLEPGTYTVIEDTSKNPEGVALVGDNGVEVEVTANNTANVPTAEFTNNKTEVGSLKIKKNVRVNGRATTGTAADGIYTFTISGPDNYSSEQTITITNGISKEVQVDNLEPGTYTITEDTSKNPEGVALVGDNGIEVTVTANNTANVPTAEFTNNKTEVGSLKIKKNVTVNGKTTTGTNADGTYTFQVKDAEGNVKAEKTITITNGVSNEVRVDNLEPGTYTVTEDTSKNPEGMALVGENGVEVEVTANNTANVPTAEFTNNKTEVGSLKIKKNVTVNGKTTTGTAADGTYTFQVKDAEGNVKAEKTITITNGVGNEVQVDNLEPGTYTVTEDTSKNPAGMALVGENGVEVEVTANNTANVPTAEFTNNKTEVGSLKIKKNVTVNEEATQTTKADGDYTFQIKDAEGKVKAEKTITITNGVSNEVQVDNLEPGTYTVTEDTSQNPEGVALIGDNGIEVEVTANNTANVPTAEFTNNLTYDAKGSIPLSGTKKFKYGSFDEEEFTFSVYTEADFNNAVDPGLLQRERDRNDQDFISDLEGKQVLTASTSTAQVGEDGTALFNFKTADGKDLEYTLADISDGDRTEDGYLTKSFNYVVVEDIPETAVKKTVNGVTFYYDSAKDIKYDPTVYLVTITVTDKGDGTLDVRISNGVVTFGFVNEKIYTRLLLTKNIDSLVTGDTDGELTNVTCVFKVTYTDPILGRSVSRSVSVQFDATKVSAETAWVEKIPIEATDLNVEEVYAVDYRGITKGVAIEGVDPDTGLPLWTAAFDNKRSGNKTGSGVINKVEKDGNTDSFVITNRRDSTGNNSAPQGGN